MRFVPVSGLLGVNLAKPPPADCPLVKWYNGDEANTLFDLLGMLKVRFTTHFLCADTLPVPARDDMLPLRFTVSSVYKGGQNTAGQSVSGALTLCGTILQVNNTSICSLRKNPVAGLNCDQRPRLDTAVEYTGNSKT